MLLYPSCLNKVSSSSSISLINLWSRQLSVSYNNSTNGNDKITNGDIVQVFTGMTLSPVVSHTHDGDELKHFAGS